MVAITAGLWGGFVATFVMTAVRMGLASDAGSPPSAAVWAKYVGNGQPEDYKLRGMALHFLYGTVAGGVFAWVFTLFDLGFPIDTLTGGVLWGLVYGFVLFAIGAGFWLKGVLGMSPEKKMALVFLIGHLAYGLTPGLWTGFDI